MQAYVQPQSYVNFADRSLKNCAQAYYATNLPRLSAAKRSYDPDNLFKFAQSVPLGRATAAKPATRAAALLNVLSFSV
jgi:hypothetical protein